MLESCYAGPVTIAGCWSQSNGYDMTEYGVDTLSPSLTPPRVAYNLWKSLCSKPCPQQKWWPRLHYLLLEFVPPEHPAHITMVGSLRPTQLTPSQYCYPQLGVSVPLASFLLLLVWPCSLRLSRLFESACRTACFSYSSHVVRHRLLMCRAPAEFVLSHLPCIGEATMASLWRCGPW
jgi:hypothetical protein